jgi:thiamine biosynthesis lipoprotein
VPICSEALALLEVARDVWSRSGGAFDPTVGALMRHWGFRDGEPPPAGTADTAWGGAHLHLDAANSTAQLDSPGVMLDLGAIAKGWAVDAAVAVLREAGVRRAFLHAGTSSVAAIGSPPGQPGWRVRVRAAGESRDIFLKDRALSVSAPSGRTAQRDGVVHGHILDPSAGEPARDLDRVAVCVHESGTFADAWSTALLVRDSLEGLDTPADLDWACFTRGAWREGGPDPRRTFLRSSTGSKPPEASHAP